MRSVALSLVTFFVSLSCAASARPESVGSLTRRATDAGIVYEWQDGAGHKIAQAKRQAYPWGTRLDVVDGRDALLGTVTEERVRTVHGTTTYYSLFDPAGRQVAESDKIEWPKGALRWNAAPAGVDARVLAMLDAYRADVQRERVAQPAPREHAPAR